MLYTQKENLYVYYYTRINSVDLISYADGGGGGSYIVLLGDAVSNKNK